MDEKSEGPLRAGRAGPGRAGGEEQIVSIANNRKTWRKLIDGSPHPYTIEKDARVDRLHERTSG